jgi:hypothetical protein
VQLNAIARYVAGMTSGGLLGGTSKTSSFHSLEREGSPVAAKTLAPLHRWIIFSFELPLIKTLLVIWTTGTEGYIYLEVFIINSGSSCYCCRGDETPNAYWMVSVNHSKAAITSVNHCDAAGGIRAKPLR